MYKFVWTPCIGDILSLSAEDGNENDSVADERLCCCWPMTKACAYNQDVLMLEYFVQVETIAYKYVLVNNMCLIS